jgi:nifR3 family TIM-barrel protein
MNLGPVQLHHPFCQAGLAGYSDRAMRIVARRRGCPYAVTEALLDVILLSGGQGLKKSIDINDEDHPVAGQIIGSDGNTMARSAVILAERGYDVIDLNFACPVKKIKNKARGGHMLQDVPRGTEILKAVRDALPPNVPTTVSLRRGFDDSPESVDRFYELTETAFGIGYSAIRVHARSVDQKYQGRANWDFLTQVKVQYPDKIIFGSGDLFTAEAVVEMLETTGVDVAWIARGAIGNPWIFKHAATLLAMRSRSSAMFSEKLLGNVFLPPTIAEQREALTEHFSIAMEIHGESLAGRRMRKMGIKYSRFHPQASLVKKEFIDVHSLRDWTGVLDRWYREDGPGVWPAADAADEVNDGEAVGCGVGES